MDFDCTAWVLVAINHSYTLLGFCIGCTSLGFGLAALWPQDCVGYALLVLILAAVFLGFGWRSCGFDCCLAMSILLLGRVSCLV